MEKKYYILRLDGQKVWYSDLEEVKSLRKYDRVYDADGVMVWSPYEGE